MLRWSEGVDDDVLAKMRSIPGYEDLDRLEEVTRLGGLTNRVYRVRAGGEPVILRIPGDGTETYIDREVEAANARAAARVGVTPEVLYIDPARGLMLSRHVDGSTMTPAVFATAVGAPGRAARAFRSLHTSGVAFAFRFEVFAMIDDYLRVLADLDAALPEGYHGAVAEAQVVREALDAHPAALAPCHCDPLCENFIDAGDRMWLVDWEYSGMNDPLWDLGDLSVEAEFAPDQDEEMLEAYFGGRPPVAARGRMVAYKAMCDLLWTLWGLIQHTKGNAADDFWAYATNRFERCRRLMRRADFGQHLAVVRAGDGRPGHA
jgi:thiamine kinase-like enzyme